MKKKIIIVLFLLCILCGGCTPLQKMSLDEIIANGTDVNVKVYNKYRKGYKYYVPKGLDVTDNTEYNEVVSSNQYTYYLYVDAVSYYNKIIETYEINEEAYFSKAINFQDKYGYLEINELKNGKYFIEIMYNYAKIEVIVKDDDVNLTVANSLSILSSIKFNDNVLKALLDEETSQFEEIEFNIFETKSNTDSLYVQTMDEDFYNNDEDEIHDSDLIN